MHVSYGNKTLVDTITFIMPGLGPATVVIGDGAESLTFELQFEKVADVPQKLAVEQVNQTTGKLTFTNWENVLGTGLIDPVEIGAFRRRKLYFLPFVRKVGSKSEQRIVTLTFYIGEEVPGGQD